MSIIKQVLLLKQQGMSNRGVSRRLKTINKETVNKYMRLIEQHRWRTEDLLEIADPVLDRMFHPGNPAYTDPRKEELLQHMSEYRDLTTDRKSHVTKQQLYTEYRSRHPDGYGRSQFYYHLSQDREARNDVKALLTGTHEPGKKLMVDFAGDKLSYVDPDTGEIIKVEVFVACMPYSNYTYAICVPTQKTEDFLFAIRMCLEHLGGVPQILVTDNLKAAVTKADRHEPTVSRALRDMGNYYRFVVIPCDPHSPTQKGHVENAVRNTYYSIYAKLRGRIFHSIMELNEAVWSLMRSYNQTRMQKLPYTREERFHAKEKECLGTLPATPYEMLCHADIHVQRNGHIELQTDGVTHYYSVPGTYVGKPAHVIYTRSRVDIYVNGEKVASHQRSHEPGRTTENGHLTPNNRFIAERSAESYCDRAVNISDDCGNYIREMFNPKRTRVPAEAFYRVSDAILGMRRLCEGDIFNLTCRQCLEIGIFSSKSFESILRRNIRTASKATTNGLTAPVPTNHANMRGAGYFWETTTTQY